MPDLKPFTEACSTECYMHLKDMKAASPKMSTMDSGNEADLEDSSDSNGTSSKNGNESTTVSPTSSNTSSVAASISSGIASLMDTMNNKDAKCEWTGSDQSLFRALRKVFMDNYCVIALSMRTKTCQQVSVHTYFMSINSILQ